MKETQISERRSFGDRAAELGDWIASATGATVESLKRRPGGGRRQAWMAELCCSGEPLRAFLRYDPFPLKPWDPYSLHREAEVYRALAGTPVPVAEVLAVHPEIQAVLLRAMPGAAPFATIEDGVAKQRLADELCEKLVALHALDAAGLAVPSFGPVRNIRDHLLEELDIWETMYRKDARPDPLLTASLRWLRENGPDDDGVPSLLQGDTGPGNFMHEDGRITAFVDWEFAHLGDPVEDLAWVSCRSTQEPLPDLPGFVADYERRSGRRVDADRLRYFQVFVELRIAVLYARRRSDEPSGGEVGNGLAFAYLHRRLLAETLARVVEAEVAPLDEPEPPVPEDEWLFREALAQLKDVVLPAVADPFARLRTKGIARLVKYFQGVARYRDDLRARTLAELESLLGARFPGLAQAKEEAERRIASGALDVARAAPALLREVQREVRMLSGVMGVLARRSFTVPGAGS